MTPRTPTLSAEQKARLLEAIKGKVTLPRVTRMYVVGLAMTAAAVLLLPLLYIALMTLVAGVLFLTVRHVELILPGCPVLMRGIFAGFSCLFGMGLLIALLKPFLAQSAAIKRPRVLRKDAEPFLMEFINRLCDALGAPRPTAIHITCDINAAAELRTRWSSRSGRPGIALYIGLPLVAGLTLQQFTGILAHELGHFTQRTAMWLENIVRRTNHWFLRAAYERDAIDERLLKLCTSPGPVAGCCYIVRAMVWLSRQILLGFAFAGTAISCLMSREMEFNADRCQVRIVGSGILVATMRRLRELHVAHQISFRDIAAFYDEGRLPDDMIALSVANVGFITPKVRMKLHRMMIEESTALFDTHPSDRDRMQAAESDGSPGLFSSVIRGQDLPATLLFDRFQVLSKAVTEQFYRDALDQEVPPRMLHPVEKLLDRQMEEIHSGKALRRYFQTEIPQLRPLPIAPQSAEAPQNPDEVISHLKLARQRMIEELPTYQRITPRYRAAEEVLFETIAAQTLLQANLRFEAAEFHLVDSSPAAIEEKLRRAREGIVTLTGKMLPFETEAGNRLSFALQMLHVPSFIDEVQDGDNLWYEVNELLPQAQYVSRLIGELPSLRIVFHRLMVLWERSESRDPGNRVLGMIHTQTSTVKSRLIAIQQEMGTHLYPFDHARAETTLRDYALPRIPDEHDPGGLVKVTSQMQSRLITIQSRLFARLARAAEKIEETLGMPSLPEPPLASDE